MTAAILIWRGTSSKRVKILVIVISLLATLSLVRMWADVLDLTSRGTISAALGLAVPIGLAGLGGLWAERAGVVNIGLEGMMILGTFGAGWLGWQYGPWAGLAGALLFGLAGAAIFAVATITFGVDQIISGTAMNILGLGFAQFFAQVAFSDAPGGGPTQSPSIEALPSFTWSFISDPLVDLHREGYFIVSEIAGFVSGVFFRLSILTVIAAGLFFASGYILWRTPFGLRLRSVGENPHAADSLGVNVYFYKYIAVLNSGMLAALGGAFLAIASSGVYREGQTGGRGFIGLATMIFGNWRPGGTAAGAAVFGYIDALQLRDANGTAMRAVVLLGALVLFVLAVLALRAKKYQTMFALGVISAALISWFLVTTNLPKEIALVAPYLATLLVLAFASQRLRPPAADGIPYRKGESK
ncbi:MAG: ABC transporter permease [Actinobacteria bacterium]|nr:ABC transporter permease [Actinomycetota bacterium]